MGGELGAEADLERVNARDVQGSMMLDSATIYSQACGGVDGHKSGFLDLLPWYLSGCRPNNPIDMHTTKLSRDE
jgi:hypothetical protein